MSALVIRYAYLAATRVDPDSTWAYLNPSPSLELLAELCSARLPRGSYWILLRRGNGRGPLEAVYELEPSVQRIFPPALELPELQEAAAECLLSLTMLDSQRVRDTDPVWLHLGRSDGIKPVAPPELPAPSLAPKVRLEGLPEAPFLEELSARFGGSMSPELRAEINRQWDRVADLLQDAGEGELPMIRADFYRGVAYTAGSHAYGRVVSPDEMGILMRPGDLLGLAEQRGGQHVFRLLLGNALMHSLDWRESVEAALNGVHRFCQRRWGFGMRMAVELMTDSLPESRDVILVHPGSGRILLEASLPENQVLLRGPRSRMQAEFGRCEVDFEDGSAWRWVDADHPGASGLDRVELRDWFSDALRRWFWHHPAELFGSQDAAEWLAELGMQAPVLLEECDRLGLRPIRLRQVLRQLLQWRRSLHDGVGIVEAILDWWESQGKDASWNGLAAAQTVREQLPQSALLGLPLARRRVTVLHWNEGATLEQLRGQLESWQHSVEPVVLVEDGQRAQLEPRIHKDFPWLVVLERREIPARSLAGQIALNPGLGGGA